MDIDEQGCLNRFLNHAKSQLEPVVAVVPDHWGETKLIPSRRLHTMLGPTRSPLRCSWRGDKNLQYVRFLQQNR